MKAVFTGNGDSRGRIGAPLVSIPNCGTTTTTTATTTTTTTATTILTTATTVPPSTSGTAVVASIPSNVNVETVTSPPLPSTGGTEISAAGIAIVALGVGCMLVVVTRRRLTDDLPD